MQEQHKTITLSDGITVSLYTHTNVHGNNSKFVMIRERVTNDYQPFVTMDITTFNRLFDFAKENEEWLKE